jgi:hypothetical protein
MRNPGNQVTAQPNLLNQERTREHPRMAAEFTASDSANTPHRFTVAEYVALDIPWRIELIEGVIYDVAPKNEPPAARSDRRQRMDRHKRSRNRHRRRHESVLLEASNQR